jgi:hypothetical protein
LLVACLLMLGVVPVAGATKMTRARLFTPARTAFEVWRQTEVNLEKTTRRLLPVGRRQLLTGAGVIVVLGSAGKLLKEWRRVGSQLAALQSPATRPLQSLQQRLVTMQRLQGRQVGFPGVMAPELTGRALNTLAWTEGITFMLVGGKDAVRDAFDSARRQVAGENARDESRP